MAAELGSNQLTMINSHLLTPVLLGNKTMVGDEGFEPSVFWSQTRRINQTFPISE
jgi:hypothetical protein